MSFITLLGGFLFLAVHVTGYQGIKSKQDGLRHWTDDYNLDIARSAEVVVGAPMDVVFTILEARKDYTECKLNIGKDGKYVIVTKNSVIDENGAPAEGITSWSGHDDHRICGITIASYDPALLGEDCLTISAEFTLDALGLEMTKLYGQVSMEEDVVLGLRLPETAFPTEQVVYLYPDYTSDFLEDGSAHIAFTGLTDINITVTEDMPCVILHADEMFIRAVDIFGYELQYVNLGFDYQRTFTYICLDNDMFKKNQKYTVRLDYSVDTIRGGYYQYGFYYKPCTQGSSKNCWFTQGESTSGRNIFPGFDEPAFKAVTSLIIPQAPEGYSVLSNTPQGSAEDGELHFPGTVPMSGYLFAVAITDYVELKSDVREDVSVWCSLEDMVTGRAIYSAEMGARVIDFYEEYFGVKYSLPKLDLVSEIQKFGAMENWGLVLFDPRTLLLDPAVADLEISDTKWTVSTVVAHELAHQWFGNLVTCDWWSQTWLNEGFATYVSYLGAQVIDPNNLPWARMVVEDTQYAMYYDSNTNEHWPMTDPVTTRSDVDRKFGVFTYSKGGSVIRMMEGILTEPVSRSGLGKYLEEFSYEAATEDGLFFYLGQAGEQAGTWPGTYTGDMTFPEVMKTWTNQAGFPIISATINEEIASFSQMMYATSGEVDMERTWAVPIFTNFPGSNLTRTIWLDGTEEVSFDLKSLKAEIPDDTVLIANHDAYGYYRVMYDDAHWGRIAEVIRTNKELIPVLSRISIICDVLEFFENGLISDEVYDTVTSAWNGEMSQEETWAYDECSYRFKNIKARDYKYRI